MQRQRGILIFLLVGMLLFLWGTSLPAWAARFSGGDRIVIGPEETVSDDLYAAAREIVIEGTVDGDVYALAQRIVIGPDAHVTGDLVAAAQVIDVQGVVADDVRVMGYVVRVLSPQVGDDIVAMAFSVELGKGSSVGGSILGGAYQVLVHGKVAEDVLVAANGISIRGRVGGNVSAIVGERGARAPAFWAFFLTPRDVPLPAVPSGLTVGENATIGGDLMYQSVQEASIAAGAHIGGKVDHRLPPPPAEETRPPAFGSLPWMLDQARRLVMYILVGAGLFLLTPTGGRALARRISRRPLSALGWGIVAVAGLIGTLMIIVLGTAILFLLLNVLTLNVLARWALALGGALGAVLLVAYLIYVNLLAPVLVSYAVFRRLDRGGWWWILPLLLGGLLYVVLTSLPYAGWIFSLLVVLVGMGGMVIWYREPPG